jgi:AcrR family transcriptional regulator
MAVDKKAHIMNHAITLFADRGFEGTSIRELAHEANVNVAMVNYYFGSKEKLVEAIIDEKAAYMKDRLEELEANERLTEIEKIDRLIEDYVTRILAGASFHKFLYKELMDTKREDIQEFLTNSFARNAKSVASIIEKGIQKKTFKAVDPALTVASIIGSISHVMMSKSYCNKLLQKPETNEPYTDEEFRIRLINHIQNMMHAHLLVVSDKS